MQRERKFGLTVGIAFILLALLLWWRDRLLVRNVAAALGSILVVMAVFVPRLLGSVEKAWMAGATVMSRIMTPVLMGLVYYIAVTPIGLIMKLFGKNPLKHASDGVTYWVDRSATGETRSELERQF